MRFIKLSLILGALFHFSAAKAQNYIDLASVQYQYSLPSQFDSSADESDITEFSFSFTLPIVLSKKTVFITGGTINKYTLDMVPKGPSTTISTYLFKAGFNIKHSEKVTGTYLLLPKLASDFESDVNSNDFQFGALGLLKFNRKENFKYKVGLYYNPDLFGTFFVPILGLYSKTEKWEVDLTIPVSAKATYSVNQSWSLGADFQAIVKSFNLHRAFFYNPNQMGQKPNGEYLHQATNEISAFISHEFKPGIILKGQVGYSIGRSYRIYDNSDKIDFGISAFKFGDNRNQLNSDFTDGMVFRAQLIYRLYLDDK
jgi:hypothetical protein